MTGVAVFFIVVSFLWGPMSAVRPAPRSAAELERIAADNRRRKLARREARWRARGAWVRRNRRALIGIGAVGVSAFALDPASSTSGSLIGGVCVTTSVVGLACLAWQLWQALIVEQRLVRAWRSGALSLATGAGLVLLSGSFAPTAMAEIAILFAAFAATRLLPQGAEPVAKSAIVAVAALVFASFGTLLTFAMLWSGTRARFGKRDTISIVSQEPSSAPSNSSLAALKA